MASANLQSRISLDATKFQAGLRAAGVSAKKFSSSLTSGFLSVGKMTAGLVANVGKLTAAFGALGAAALALGLKNAFDLGGKLSDFSARTGIAVDQLIVMRRALEDNGIAGDKVAFVINKMQKSIGEMGQGLSTQVRAFESLGISFEQMQRLNPAQQFELIQRSIAGLENPAQRATLAMQIFGRAGAEMLTLFKDEGALDKAAQSVGSQAQILAKNAQTFDRISDLLNGASQKLQGFFVGFADIAAGPVLAVLERFDKLDLAGIGKKFGEAMTPVLELMVSKIGEFRDIADKVAEGLEKGLTIFTEAWRSEQMSELIGLTVEIGFLKGVEGAKNGIVEMISSAIHKAINPFAGTDTGAVTEFKMAMAAAGKELTEAQIKALDATATGTTGSESALQKREAELSALVRSLENSAARSKFYNQFSNTGPAPVTLPPIVAEQSASTVTAAVEEIKKAPSTLSVAFEKVATDVKTAGQTLVESVNKLPESLKVPEGKIRSFNLQESEARRAFREANKKDRRSSAQRKADDDRQAFFREAALRRNEGDPRDNPFIDVAERSKDFFKDVGATFSGLDKLGQLQKKNTKDLRTTPLEDAGVVKQIGPTPKGETSKWQKLVDLEKQTFKVAQKQHSEIQLINQKLAALGVV